MDIISFFVIGFYVGWIDDFQNWIDEFITSIYNGIKAFFVEIANAIIDKISQFFLDIWELVTSFVKSILLTFLDILKDFFFFIFESLLSLVILILDAVGTAFDLVNISNWINFPPEVANMIGLIGLGQAMGLIMSAIVIRISLQLIPFTRLGS